MAFTLIFSLIAAATGAGAVTAAVVTTIGALIDLSLQDDVEGPRIGDMSVSGSNYGVPIPLLYGPSTRVSGNIIWLGEVNETRHKESSGLFGLGPSNIWYTYDATFAIAINGRPTDAITKIYMNNELFLDITYGQTYDLADYPTVSQTTGLRLPKYYSSIVGFQDTRNDVYAALTAIYGDTNNFLGEVLYKLTTRQLYHDLGELYFYPGSSVQEPSPTMELFEGAGEVPGYRNVSYVVFRHLHLEKFGNRIPNIQFEVATEEEITVSGILRDLSTRAGIESSSQIHLSDEVQGFYISNNAPMASAIKGMAELYRFNAVEQNGDLRFIRRPGMMQGTIPLSHMGAYSSGGKPSSGGPIKYEVLPETESIKELSVTALDPDRDHQQNTYTAFREVGASSNRIGISAPITMAANDIRSAAEMILKSSWARKWKVEFTVSDRYSHVQAGYVLGIPFNDEIFPMLVIRTTRGANGLIEVECQYQDITAENISLTSMAAPSYDQAIVEFSSSLTVLMDAPLILNSLNDDGFYWSVDAGDDWDGTELYRSVDGGTTYNLIRTQTADTTIGTVSNAISDGNTVIFDNSTVITVETYNTSASFQSATEAEVLSGANLVWVGPPEGGEGEFIQFQNAVQSTGGVWELTKLLRGRYGTEHRTGLHADDEVCVLMDPVAVRSESFGVSDWNQSRLYQTEDLYNGEDDYLRYTTTFTNTGIRARPLSGVHVKGTRDTSNNLTVTWVRRARGDVTAFATVPTPLNEVTESYEIDVTTTGGTVLRTITATTPEITYTATQQFNDGLTPGDPVDLSIYQMSDTYGRGYPARSTV